VHANCVGFEPEQGHVISHFSDGQQQQADLLVGADGLYSVIREQLLGKRPPRYSGYTCWRGVALFEERHVSPGISSETWGRGRRFGMLPIGKGRVFWYATYNCPAGERDRAGERKSRLSRLFGGWREPIGRLIEATDEEAILRYDLFDRRPVRHWGSQPPAGGMFPPIPVLCWRGGAGSRASIGARPCRGTPTGSATMSLGWSCSSCGC
jgi:2-polyprenyl-6-methoxyphenol hydroxylase-like FAD-dependent oxidoreductase